MLKERSLAQRPSSRDSVQVRLSRCLLSLPLRVSRHKCAPAFFACLAQADLLQSIDDRKAANPRMRGFLHGSSLIWQEKGIRGFFQGFVPTTARQAANSAVRFSSYTSLKQLAQSYVAPGEKLGAVSTFGLGGLAGIITVYTTMPIDTVKTRMQSIEARAAYKNSLDCVVKIFKNEGIFTFWSGALPRLGRLILSGGIVFTM
jgi:solute carrier family 25 citrate transporter 1